VRVEALAQVADALLEFAFFERGEWEGFETTGVVIARPIFERPTLDKGPYGMNVG
jgi:hypothetical protein